MEEIRKEWAGEYRDVLLALTQNEESQVLLEEGYWDAGMGKFRNRR